MEMFLLLPMYAILPLVQPAVPVLWIVIHHVATAVVLAVFHDGTVQDEDEGDEEEQLNDGGSESVRLPIRNTTTTTTTNDSLHLGFAFFFFKYF